MLTHHVVMAALMAVFVSRFTRTLQWVKKRMEAGKKPWACDLCMGFQTSLLITGALYWNGDIESFEQAIKLLLASAGLSSVLLTLTSEPQIPPLP